MDKIKECFDSVKIIKGVGSGVVTKEQTQILVIKYQLNEDEEKAFYKMLDEHNIHPIVEKDIEQCDKAQPTVSEETPHREVAVLFGEERFEGIYQACQEKIREIPKLQKQYEKEMSVLMDAIVKRADAEDDVLKVICKAVMDISYLRVEERRKKGWVCGTYVSRRKMLLESWIYHLFSQEELTELIKYCESGRAGSKSEEHWNKVLTVLLFKAPPIIVHRRYDFLD